MQRILLLIDGLGDSPEFFRKCRTPNLDKLVSKHVLGYFKSSSMPQSDTAILKLFGAKLNNRYTGRGPLESLGAGVFKSNSTMLRANFATASLTNSIWKAKIIDRRVGRSLKKEETKKLAASVNKLGYGIFTPTLEHRGVFTIKGIHKIKDPDTAYLPYKKEVISKTNLKPVNMFLEQSYDVLNKHPINAQRIKDNQLAANCILLRGAGSHIPEINMKKWHACIGAPLEKGIAKAAGMKIIHYKYPKQGKNYLMRSLHTEIRTAQNALKKYPKLWIHIKPVDDAGHDKNKLLKKKMIELLDRTLVKKLLNVDVVLITGDHATPVSKGVHTADPVPVVVKNPSIQKKTGKLQGFYAFRQSKIIFRQQNLVSFLGD